MNAQMMKMLRTMRDYRALQRRIEELDAHLRELSAAYYNDSEAQVSDDEFDSMMDELERLEKTYPELSRPDSATQTVGAPPPGWHRVKHPRRILSLRKVNTVGAIENFWRQTRTPLMIEEKIDGLTAVLTYKGGRLHSIVTRGDGNYGTDVTQYADMVSGLPTELPEDVVIRAEVYCTCEAFEHVNTLRKSQGMHRFQTCRSAASRMLMVGEAPTGILNYKVIELIDGSKLSAPPPTHLEFRYLVDDWRMPFADGMFTTTRDEIRHNMIQMDKARAKAHYPTDGLVIKINDFKMREALGEMASGPKWAIAFKKVRYDLNRV